MPDDDTLSATEPSSVAEPWSVVEHLVRNFRASSADETELVTRVCAEAVRLIEPAGHAGVILTGGRRHLAIVAATDEIPRRLDEFQQRSGSGPCLTAAHDQAVVRIEDVVTDTRWAAFAAAARSGGVRAMLCLPLRLDETTYGTLSLYAPVSHSLTPSTEPIARVLATLAAITLSETRRITNFERALSSRDIIGQAKGIIMNSQRVTAETAFRMLTCESQARNIKLVDLALKIAETGTF